jgi:hypothetical protein
MPQLNFIASSNATGAISHDLDFSNSANRIHFHRQLGPADMHGENRRILGTLF